MTVRRVAVVSSVGLLLVDAPVLLVVCVLSLRFGFRDTFDGVVGWRRAHPASYGISVVALLLLTLRTRRTA